MQHKRSLSFTTLAKPDNKTHAVCRYRPLVAVTTWSN